MSAWVATDKHIASVVCAAVKEDLRQEYADEIKRQNIRSVNHRYNKRTKITPCDLSRAVVIPAKDVVSLAHSLNYQSCERPDWKRTKAYRVLREIVFDVAINAVERGLWEL